MVSVDEFNTFICNVLMIQLRLLICKIDIQDIPSFNNNSHCLGGVLGLNIYFSYVNSQSMASLLVTSLTIVSIFVSFVI